MQVCVVDNFLIWNHLCKKITFEFLAFEIQNFQTTSDGETIQIKVADIKKLWNFVVDNFFVWIRLGPKYSF
jgi:hypothetical protein